MLPVPLPYPDPSEASERSSIASSFPFVSAKEGQHWACRFVDEYIEAQCFLESLPCSHKEVWWCWAGGEIRDEGGDRTKEGSGLPWLRVWWRDMDWSGSTNSLELGGWMAIIGHCVCLLTGRTGGIVEVDKDGLGRNPMFNYEVTEVREATCSKATSWKLIPSIVEETPFNWEDTKGWSPQISLTQFLTNSILGVNPTSRVGWGRFNLAQKGNNVSTH